MRTELIRIGNSRGIRIPKPLIVQCGLGDTVDLQVEDGSLVINPVRRPREGWAEALRTAGSSDEHKLLLEGAGSNRFDVEEWEW